MRTILIGLAMLVFMVVCSLLNQVVKKAQEEQMTRLWNEREQWRDPTTRPRRHATRRSRRRVGL